VEDLVELINIISSLEEGLASEKFGQNAANRPDINCGRVRKCPQVN
jgi:hypothetical protein